MTGSTRARIVTLLSGTAIAQAIPVAGLPILTRIYDPSQMGVLALFASVTSVLAIVASGRYEQAIILPADDDEAAQIAILGVLCSVSIAGLIAIFLLATGTQRWASLLGDRSVANYFWLIPVAVLAAGLFNVFNFLALRREKYGPIARSTVWRSVGIVGGQLSLGTAGFGVLGLLAPQALGNAVAAAALYASGRLKLGAVKLNGLVGVAWGYRRFPLVSTWGALSNATAAQAPAVAVAAGYSLSVVGHYGVAQRVVGLPVTLVGTSVSQLVQREAAKEFREFGDARRTFTMAWHRLLPLAGLFMLVVALASPTVFEIALGEQWRESGEYARLLAPAMGLRLLVSPLSTINLAVDRVGAGTAANVVLLLLTVGTSVAMLRLGWGVATFLAVLSAAQSMFYLAFFFLIRSYAYGGRSV